MRQAAVPTTTRLVYPQQSKNIALQLHNDAATAAVAQVWLERERSDECRLPNAGRQRLPFVLEKATVAVAAEGTTTVRITYLPQHGPPLPTAQESVFYLNVLDIPPVFAGSLARNELQMALCSRIKLFFRPTGLTGEDATTAAGALRWRRDPQGLTAHNPSPFHVSYTGLQWAGGGNAAVSGMLAPHATQTVVLPPGTSVPDTFTLQWVNDLGRTEQQTATIVP